MGRLMAPAANHRQCERGRLTWRFVDRASSLMTLAMVSLLIGLAYDAFILVFMGMADTATAVAGGLVVVLVLTSLQVALPRVVK